MSGGALISAGFAVAWLSSASTWAEAQEVTPPKSEAQPSPPAVQPAVQPAVPDAAQPLPSTNVTPPFQPPTYAAPWPTPNTQRAPFYPPLAPLYPQPAYGKSLPKTRRKVDVPAVVFGGTFMAAGGVGILVGFGGYFSSVSCERGTWGFPSCRSNPDWLWAAAGGFLLAGAAGTPLLVVGLRGSRVPVEPAKAALISSPELVIAGPTEAGVRFRF